MYVCMYVYIYIYIYSPVQSVFIQMPSQDNKLNPNSSSKTWRNSGVVSRIWSRLLRYFATSWMMNLGLACCLEKAFG